MLGKSLWEMIFKGILTRINPSGMLCQNLSVMHVHVGFAVLQRIGTEQYFSAKNTQDILLTP